MHAVFRGTKAAVWLAALVLIAGVFTPADSGAEPPAGYEQRESAQEASTGQEQKQWSPYLAGACIGILCWISFLVSNKPIGISTAYVRTAGMIEKRVSGPQAEKKAYYEKYPPAVDWEWMLVVGVILGAFIAARTDGMFSFRFLPETWAAGMGETYLLRWLSAFAGGAVMGIGARWAGGCTSGHGISGTLQLAVSSWIVIACMFAGGVVTAFLLY